jgi:hypothetical protein
MEYRLFYERGNREKPWTLRVQEAGGWAHYGASAVFFMVPSWTEGDPDAPTSQKFYLVAKGKLRWVGAVAYIE